MAGFINAVEFMFRSKGWDYTRGPDQLITPIEISGMNFTMAFTEAGDPLAGLCLIAGGPLAIPDHKDNAMAALADFVDGDSWHGTLAYFPPAKSMTATSHVYLDGTLLNNAVIDALIGENIVIMAKIVAKMSALVAGANFYQAAMTLPPAKASAMIPLKKAG